MASIVDLPLKEKEKTAVKWAIYQLSGMLAFALSQICKQIRYFSDRDKEEMIRLGLLYGKNSKAKIEDILKITNNIARKTLSTFCVEEKLIDSLPEIRLSYPDYTEAFISIIFRMIDQPLFYKDILRFIQFSLFEYDLNEKSYCMDELGIIFNNVNELLKSEKVLLHFICHTTGIDKAVFLLLRDLE